MLYKPSRLAMKRDTDLPLAAAAFRPGGMSRRMRPLAWALCCLFLFGFMLPPSLCAENAKLPYQQIYEMQKVQAKLSRTYTNVQIFLKMSSRLTEVKISDLQIHIDARDGRIPVKLGSDGTLSLPMSDALQKENPWIVVNQPRGSMQLEWRFGLNTAPVTTHMRYRELMQGINDLEPIQEQMLQVFSSVPKLTVSGLKLIFGAAKEGAAVVIHAKSGDRILKIDAHGEAVIPLDRALLEENPEVVLPEMPKKLDVAGSRNAP
jgi:Protein of unknown function (DUF2987)